MNMVNLDTIQHHPAIEEITDVLCTRIQNNDRHFFRVITAYYLSTIAAQMRARIKQVGPGQDIPVNCYAVALAPSGAGKGWSTGIIEDEFMAGFRDRFTSETLPTVAERHIWKLATQRAVKNDTTDEAEKGELEAEYARTGAYLYTFDGSSESAIKQIRQKLLIADIGSINLQIDEIGSKLMQMSVTEALNTFLELYDQGRVKQKLKMNSAENKRTVEIHGKTPANAFLFGTPDKLLDGAKTEEAFYSFLDTGYARRSLFAFGQPIRAGKKLTAKERYQLKINPGNTAQLKKWSTHFTFLADPSKHNWLMDLPEDVAIAHIEYQDWCEGRAENISSVNTIARAEMQHRHSKVLKLSGALAFIDESTSVTMDHLNAAIKLVEESGKAFQDLLERDGPEVKLANYIADVGKDVTHSDLTRHLPFYPKNKAGRDLILGDAIAWGYKNNVIVKKTFTDGIEFFSGEKLQETNLDAVHLSYSQDFAQGYQADTAKFDDLHILTQAEGFHWATHAFENEHRNEENVIPGFDLMVVDVDGTADMDQTHELLSDFTFMTHTTKRHTPTEHRFRLIFPMNYKLYLDKEDFALFTRNFLQWLPIQVDEAAMQRSRKWASNHNGHFHLNHGTLIDVLPFIPKTSRNEDFHARNKELGSLNNLERWFAERMVNGDRNNQMIKFALALVDSGMDYLDVERHVVEFNDKLAEGLPTSELKSTVLVTVAKRLQQQTP